ncbi:Carbamate kinase 1 [Nocardioides aquaticus]|uniref:Carbamate kinase n=1 Tax=Nocardioides aquaticus TaxID=160826 RepID=A0ABX8EH17_9ACTN|nr:carbamate kinase [Nocardioides aquaticus]QVT79830.1 Carbamate kinase 1 [Nocardioides aquaticus]
MRVVVALGGNALLPRGEVPDAVAQVARVSRAAPALARVAAEHEVVLVHGNGPQVGMLALETAADAALSRPYPFSELVAETQGLIGYWLQQGLVNAGLTTPVVTLVTQTLVAADDPAFADPTKFVGSVYDEARAHELAAREGWTVRPDGAGWRRVVASPLPTDVLEVDTARLLLEHGTTVVLAGGGGVPVVEGVHGLTGVDAVVDKDFVAALVATRLGADALVLLTDVPAVMAGWGTPGQRALGEVRAADLVLDDFPAGSMGPKVAAAAGFVTGTGGRAAIGSLDDAAAVVAGTAGTQVR